MVNDSGDQEPKISRVILLTLLVVIVAVVAIFVTYAGSSVLVRLPKEVTDQQKTDPVGFLSPTNLLAIPSESPSNTQVNYDVGSETSATAELQSNDSRQTTLPSSSKKSKKHNL